MSTTDKKNTGIQTVPVMMISEIMCTVARRNSSDPGLQRRDMIQNIPVG